MHLTALASVLFTLGECILRGNVKFAPVSAPPECSVVLLSPCRPRPRRRMGGGASREGLSSSRPPSSSIPLFRSSAQQNEGAAGVAVLSPSDDVHPNLELARTERRAAMQTSASALPLAFSVCSPEGAREVSVRSPTHGAALPGWPPTGTIFHLTLETADGFEHNYGLPRLYE